MLNSSGNFEYMPLPEYVYIKVDQDFRRGKATYASKGDFVKVGQPIIFYDGELHSVVYSSVSGQIEDYITSLDYGRLESEFVKIKTDGKQEIWEGIKIPGINNRKDFLSAIESCGIRGIEGITLATCLQMEEAELDRLDTLVVNAAEWIDYGSLEISIIKRDPELIMDMICMTMKFLGLHKCYIGVTEDRQDAIACLKWFIKEKALENIEIIPLQHTCPPGSDRLLVFETMGELLDARMLATDMGILIANIISFSALGHYIREGMPVINKIITVTDREGSASKDILVPLGAAISDVISYCTEGSALPEQILLGGYDVSKLLKNYELPLGRDNLAVFVFDKYSESEAETPARLCSECNICKDNCPSGLDPGEIYREYMKNDIAGIRNSGVENCAECGRCAYVCSDKKPLDHIVKIAKQMIAG